MKRDDVIYSICIDDIYQVAEELGRDLAKFEIRLIANKIGDYIDWHQAIEDAISDSLR